MNPRNLIRLTGNDIKQMKDAAVMRRDLCPILKQPVTDDTAVIDHKHITKAEIKRGEIGKDGKGLLRGCIHTQANVFIGKIEKSFKRSGCHKFGVPLVDQLRAIADYLENPPMPQRYIHPNEKVKKETLTMTEYKRICKYYFEIYPKRKKLPPYPKTKKANKTSKWIRLLHLADELNASKTKRDIKRVKS